MKIEIKSEIVPFIESAAIADGVTPEVWVERKVNGLVRGLWREQIVNIVKDVSLDDIHRIGEVLRAEKEAIVAERPVSVKPADKE